MMLSEIISVRASPVQVCGHVPAVRFYSVLEDGFTLLVNAEQARELESMLNRELDIIARINRDDDGYIEEGLLESYLIVEDTDPRPAWREWFRKVLDGTP